LLAAAARAAGDLAALPGIQGDDLRDQLASMLADSGAPIAARTAALNSLIKLNDPRLDGALSQAVRDARLESEGVDLLNKVEKLLRDRKVKLSLP
jgi:hypothetical protein